MKITMRDGRTFQGTALQIVRAMQDIAFDASHFTTAEYVRWVVDNAQRFEEVALDVTGQTDDELAESLVGEMVRVGLAG